MKTEAYSWGRMARLADISIPTLVKLENGASRRCAGRSRATKTRAS